MGLSYEEAVRAGVGHLHPGAPVTSTAPGSWTVKVPGWRPMAVNEMLGPNKFVRSRGKKKDRDVVALAFKDVPKATGKRRVSLLVTLGPRQRGHDIDAYWKSLLDAIKHAGIIKDDRKEWCEIMPVRFDRGPATATTITVEDVG